MDINMKTIGSDGLCPYCHKRIPGYKPTKIAYGTPVQTCPKCLQDYYDRRFFEPAVSGFVMNELDTKRSLKIGLSGLIVFAVCLGINWLEVMMTGEYYVYLAIMQFVGLFTIIFSIIDAIRIKLGSKNKKLEFLMWQSDERLKNRDYAEFLKAKGLNVPEKYLPSGSSVPYGSVQSDDATMSN